VAADEAEDVVCGPENEFSLPDTMQRGTQHPARDFPDIRHESPSVLVSAPSPVTASL